MLERRNVVARGGVAYGELYFANPVLSSVSLPIFDIAGPEPGPGLCVMAGMHVNEVSSMEAAIRLKDCLAGRVRRGTVSILPVVNMPGLYEHTEDNCPIDGKNINFCFPGRADGSYSEALAHALLFGWCEDATALIDMHGGDLREWVAWLTLCQLTGDAAFDARTRAFARSFDAELVIEFQPGQTENTGRACNLGPGRGLHTVMSEAGSNGMLDEASVLFHVNGVLNVATQLGIIDGPLFPTRRAQRTVRGFERLIAPRDGRFYPLVDPGDQVIAGATIAVIRDLAGEVTDELTAPTSGHVVLRATHNIVREGEWLIYLGSASAP